MSNKTAKTASKINTKIHKSLTKIKKEKGKLSKTLTKASSAKPNKAKEAPKLYRQVPDSPIVLGRTYTECVHGITGVATMYAVHLTGCNRVLLSRPKDKSTSYAHLDEVWTDETTILDENNEFVVPQDTVKEPGHCGDYASGMILCVPPR